MTFDLVDGWFAARFQPHPTLAQLADRIMDKIVYSIIFPLIAVGIMWRLVNFAPGLRRIELLHAIFVLLLCIAVLVRDNFASFMRSFAIRQGQEPEPSEFTRLRTIVAAPVGALLYAHAFYIPEIPASAAASRIYPYISWLGSIPVRGLFLIEIVFFIITFGSIAAYCRKYGNYCLDDLCLDDELLRRRILSFLPNALTVMNAMMGLLAVFFAYQGRFREAYLLLMGAAMFDKLDGAVARRLGLTDPLPETVDQPRPRINLGSIMDDLADGVSFCIVPAWMFYIAIASIEDPFARKLAAGPIALFYALMGIIRLIYFTLDKSPIPGFFKGLPTPAAALLVTSPLIMLSQAAQSAPEWIGFWGIFSASLVVFSGIIMNIYPIHYLHLGRFMSRQPWFARSSILLLLAFAFTPFLGHVAFCYGVLYVLSPLVTWRIDPAVAAREERHNDPTG
jgi:phosphatidylserine synthase